MKRPVLVLKKKLTIKSGDGVSLTLAKGLVIPEWPVDSGSFEKVLGANNDSVVYFRIDKDDADAAKEYFVKEMR